MFDEILDRVTKKTVNKSAKTVKEEVKKEVKKTVKEATTGENGRKLLIASVVMSAAALIFTLVRTSKPVIVNVYNNQVV